MPYNDSPQKQTNVPTAIKAARIIDQSSRPTKRSMHVRTYSRSVTTTSAANANAPVMPRIDATLLSSRYSRLGFSTLSNCRENNAGMLSVIWLRQKARGGAQESPSVSFAVLDTFTIMSNTPGTRRHGELSDATAVCPNGSPDTECRNPHRAYLQTAPSESVEHPGRSELREM